MKDIGASVLAKLKNKAKESKISYQQCLQLFFQEEFLRRLSSSRYRENLILKGGLFIYTLTNFESRATVDVDFLLKGRNNDPENMENIINEILQEDTGNGFVSLKAGKAEPIALHRKYHGVSIQITGYIKNVRVPFNIDIGAGDVIVPEAQLRRIRPQLDGFSEPEIWTYSLESTVAEKFDAILQRLELTGRMKDFYDIYCLSLTFAFDGYTLRQAVYNTICTRGTEYNADSFNEILKLADHPDMLVKWRYFIKKQKNPELSFETVISGIREFLKPVWDSVISQESFNRHWNSILKKWDIE